MSDVYFMAAAWLWQRRAVPKGPWRHKWGSPSSLVLAETLAQLDPLPCLLPLHHVTHKRLRSLDHATPRGQPVSCYKRFVPHIYIGHASICNTLRVFLLSTYSPLHDKGGTRHMDLYDTNLNMNNYRYNDIAGNIFLIVECEKKLRCHCIPW